METVTQVLVVIGTLCAFISALADGPKAAAMVKGILGTKQSPTESPMLSVSMSKRKYWFLLVVSALALMFSITSLIVHLVSTNRPTANEWVKQVTMLENQPIHKDYENMTIELDGKRFENSRFSGVTFVYKGTKPTII